MSWVSLVQAAAPSGNDWFQLTVDPFTGGDETGDGGTGNPSDLNYFYVGQSVDFAIQMQSLSGTTASNIWIDYDPALVSASNLTTGDSAMFDSWSGQSITGGRIKSTGYHSGSIEFNGTGDFGSVQMTMLSASAPAYGTSTPAVLDINIGIVGATTESNIARNGTDLLDSAEDFQFHIWDDTIKPYAANPTPLDAAMGVLVASNYTFELRDSLNGEGDDSGVGTGVNMAAASADITFNAVSLKGSATSVCSGLFGSNLCDVTVDPPLATSFAGDTRKLNYGTLYTVEISGYEDLSTSPNVMDLKTFTFTTEADVIAPQLDLVTPAPASIDQTLDVLISFQITDRLTYPSGMSGSGVDDSTCRIDLSSASFGPQTFSTVDAEATATPIDYGANWVIDPASDFGSNETVSVRIYNCADLAGNPITELNYTFNTVILDTDGDTVLDSVDNCPATPNTNQADLDGDGLGDVCDSDLDGDTVLNTSDNCPSDANTDQADADGDGLGDACDSSFDLDSDSDTVTDDVDNCVNTPNAGQEDLDVDGIGDVCDDDQDGDTVLNVDDNCPLVPNFTQLDADLDGLGDACDSSYDLDTDGDGITDDLDNCPDTPNVDQADFDGDLLGDACDDDMDDDTILNVDDNCPLTVNTDQANLDDDEFGDACDDDMDNDAILNTEDNCPMNYNPPQDDSDGDGIGNLCDADVDGDSVLNEVDNCPLTANEDQADRDSNGIGDACDTEEERQRRLITDSDEDGVVDEEDNCPFTPNEDQIDTDGDTIGDACDPDRDDDTILNEDDNCPLAVNAEQEDMDEDDIGDVCDDSDGDLIFDATDNCPFVENPDQADEDEDGEGDACDLDDLILSVEELEEQLKPSAFEEKEEVEEEALEEALAVVEEIETIEVVGAIVEAPLDQTAVISQLDLCRADFPSADFDDVSADTDGDGLSDRTECYAKTSPVNPDTDGDTCLDGDEVNQFGTDPTDGTDCTLVAEAVEGEEEVIPTFMKVLVSDPKPGWILGKLRPRVSGVIPVQTTSVVLTAFYSDQKMINGFTRQINALKEADTFEAVTLALEEFLLNLEKAETFVIQNADNFDYDDFSEVVTNLRSQFDVLIESVENVAEQVMDNLDERLTNLGFEDTLTELELLIKDPIILGSTNVFSETFLGEQEARRFEFIAEQDLEDRKYYDVVATATLEEGLLSSTPIRFGVNTGLTIEEPVPRTIGGKLISGALSAQLLFIEDASAQGDGRLVLEIDERRPVVTGDTEFGSQVFAIWNSIVLTSSVISDSEQGSFEIQAPRDLETGINHRVTLYAVKSEVDTTLRSDSVDVYFRIEAAPPSLVPLLILLLILIALTIAVIKIIRVVKLHSTVAMLNRYKKSHKASAK